MKNNVARLLLALSCLMFVAGGCAKNEIVKKDEPITPGSTSSKAVKTEPIKTESPSTQQIRQSSIEERTAHDALEPIPSAGELKAGMENIYFDFDAFVLSQNARKILLRHADIMKKDPDIVVQIEGHCDERGSDEYNLALGEKRAKAALQYLLTMGIPPKRLSVISYGKEKPVSVGHDEASWARNRRDEFVITTE